MISKSEKRLLLKSFKNKHISKISKWCKDNEVTKENGDYFSNSMISMVFNGSTSKVSHVLLEKAIFDAADYFLHKEQNEDQKREKILNKLKSYN